MMEQWFYAFGLPAQTPTSAVPDRPKNATPNPFGFQSASNGQSAGLKRGADDEEGNDAKRPKSGKLDLVRPTSQLIEKQSAVHHPIPMFATYVKSQA